jgi:hypothetical protein
MSGCIQVEMQTPLRAVVLDNDETTGSYRLLFTILHILRRMNPIVMPYVAGVLTRLARWMVYQNVFRPGLTHLLKTIVELKKNGFIDVIVMYTNQNELEPRSDFKFEEGWPPFLYSPPQCIAFMLDSLIDTTIFDCIISRPKYTETINGYIPKRFSRILEHFPEFPKDISKIVFVDDNATSKGIAATDIPRQNVRASCWYRVDPYYKALQSKDIYNCLIACFDNRTFVNTIFQDAWEYYNEGAPSHSSTPSTYPFLRLTNFLKSYYDEIIV